MIKPIIPGARYKPRVTREEAQKLLYEAVRAKVMAGTAERRYIVQFGEGSLDYLNPMPEREKRIQQYYYAKAMVERDEATADVVKKFNAGYYDYD